MNEQAWKLWRKTGITSTDTKKIMGFDPKRNGLHVQQDKLGDIADVEEVEIMRLGLDMEPSIRRIYERTQGLKTTIKNQTRRSKTYPWLIATLDAMNEKGIPLEMKSVFFPQPGAYGAELDEQGKPTDAIPEAHIIQGTQQLMCVEEAEYIEFPVLIYGRMRLYRIQRNPELIESIAERTKQFWEKCILKGESPEPDFTHPATLDFLEGKYKVIQEDLSVDLPAEMEPIIAQYKALGSLIYNAQKERNTTKAQILNELKTASRGITASGMIVSRKSVHNDGYTVEPFDYNRITTSKIKEK